MFSGCGRVVPVSALRWFQSPTMHYNDDDGEVVPEGVGELKVTQRVPKCCRSFVPKNS